MLQPDKKKELAQKALQLRYDLLEMIGVGVAGHLGGSSSLAELMAVLYFYKMNFSADRLNDPARDRLVLSKGHAALIQYAALCEAGCFPPGRTEAGKRTERSFAGASGSEHPRY